VNRQPSPGAVVTVTLPPCAYTKESTIESPLELRLTERRVDDIGLIVDDEDRGLQGVLG
jgi:hypothetical protein